ASPIPGTEGAMSPFFSPDGSRVGYIMEDLGAIMVVTLNGAPPITVTTSRIGADGATWSSDGFIYFDGITSGGTTGVLRVGSGGGTPEQVTTVDTTGGQLDHFWPMALPVGRGILFTVEKRSSPDASDVAVLDLKTMKQHTLLQGLTARYSPTGHLIYATPGGDLVAVPFDLKRLAVTGESFALTSGVAIRPFGAVELALSRTGTLVYQTGSAQTAPSEVLYVSRDGTAAVIDTNLKGDFHTLALSPDGRRLALSRIDGTEQQIWVKQLPDGPLSKLTFEGNRSFRPSWSPDGQRIGFISNQSQSGRLYQKRADGTSPDERLLSGEGRPVTEGFWSRDGRWLIYRTATNDILARGPAPDTATVPLLTGPRDEIMPALSPDGRWLAYSSNESGQFEVFVRPFPNTQSGKWQISSRGGFDARWSHTGRELLYWTSEGTLMAVEIIPGGTFVTGRQEALFLGNNYVGEIGSWDITPDDKRFVLIRSGSGGSETRELVVVENLTRELTARREP
ncbi:MAG: hypothetical protein AB7I33_10965, partial [Gemmatimonadales bacterium]